MLCAYTRPRYQAIVYRSIRSLVNFWRVVFPSLVVLKKCTRCSHNIELFDLFGS